MEKTAYHPQEYDDEFHYEQLYNTQAYEYPLDYTQTYDDEGDSSYYQADYDSAD